MAVFNEPTKWQTSLVNSGDANVIPQSTPVGTGKASFDDGFPQITQIPLSAGGQAPDRKDFNGLFKVLGDWIFFNQNGGLPTYSADFDYVAGRVVLYNDNIYKCIQANGVSSTVVTPDSDTAYWRRLDNYVISPVVDYSSGIDIAYRHDSAGEFPRVTIPQDGLIILYGNSAYPVTEEAYAIIRIMNGDTVMFVQAASQPINGNAQLFASVNLPVKKGQQVECAITGNTIRICRLYPYIME